MSLPPKQNEKKNSLKATNEIISASSKNSITPRSSPTPDPQHPNWRARQRGDVLSSTAEGTARFGVWGQRGSAGRASRALGSGVPGAPRVVQGGTNTVTDCCLQLVVPGVLLPSGSSLAYRQQFRANLDGLDSQQPRCWLSSWKGFIFNLQLC